MERKAALVTGASSGIGRSICVQLAADHGYHILVNYLHNTEEAARTKDDVEAAGGTAEIIRFDVSIFSEVETALSAWMKANEQVPLEVLVNNAGIAYDGLLMFMNEDSWDNVVDVKLKGFYNVTRCVIQPMLLRHYGRIINISSITGVRGNQGQVNYAAANGGLIAATKALALEVGKRNVTVNAVAPGYIRTEMTKGFNEEKIKPFIPAGRFGEPVEVADLVSFLASKKTAYITGQVFQINGGLYT